MKRGHDCAVHHHREMVPQEDHHVWPKEFGGPTVPDNLKRICANAHSDVHYFLNLLLAHQGDVHWSDAQWFGTRVRSLAVNGYTRIKANIPDTVPVLAEIAAIRLNEGSSEDHYAAFRKFSVAYRGCAFGTHEPGEAHHYSCHLMED